MRRRPVVGASESPIERACRVVSVLEGVVVRGEGIEDVQSHFQHAGDAGAEITTEPTDMMFGERQYSVRDPWGQVWTFQRIDCGVAPEEWGGIAR
jgi:uncharacterized glyoxalase superfamily protein PhnB